MIDNAKKPTAKETVRRKKLGEMTVGEYFEQVFASTKIPGEARMFRVAIKQLKEFLGVELTMNELTSELIDEYRKWMSGQELADTTASNRATAVRAIGRHLSPSMFPIPTKEADHQKNPDVVGIGDEHSLWSLCFDRYIPSNHRIRSESTLTHYRRTLSEFSQFLDRPATLGDLNDDTASSFMRWMADERKHSAHTVNQRRGYLVAFWNWAIRRHLVDEHPNVPKMPAPEVDRSAWSIDEVQKLISACRLVEGWYEGIPAALFWRVFHFMLFETGERTTALLSIRWEWINAERSTLRIPAEVRKGGQKAAIYSLRPYVLQELETIRQPERTMVFPYPRTMGMFWKRYARLLESAGLPANRRTGPQKMRRTHASHLEAAGGDATRSLRHSSRSVTLDHYLDETIAHGACDINKLPVLNVPILDGKQPGKRREPNRVIAVRPRKGGDR